MQLYAAGLTGNGSGATSLLSTALTLDASGNATIPTPYGCPSTNALLYLVSQGGLISQGGQVGAPATPNPNLWLLSALGSCNAIAAGSTVVLNEASTAAAGFALAPFYAVGGVIGASSTNLTGLTNAFATAAALVDPATGVSPGSTLPAHAVSPAPRVNSVANLLHTCAVSSAACTTLFQATSSNGTLPANTLDAAFNLARNPAGSVPLLFAQSQTSKAFSPALAQAPADWTMFITYSGGGMQGPSSLGVDSTGSVWVANYFSVASRFSPQGEPVFPNGITGFGLSNAYGLAVDLKDNAWIPSEPSSPAVHSAVSVLTPQGTSLAGPSGFTAGGLSFPISIAIDPNTTAWVVDYGNSHITLLDPSGVPLSGPTGYTTDNFAFPVAVAVDGNHFGWIANQSSQYVTRVAPDGSSFTNFLCCNGASGLAIDAGNNVWVANFYGSSVSLIPSSGVIGSPFTGLDSLNHPQGIAIDGSGNVWVANFRAPYLTELAGISSGQPGAALTPARGFGADAALLEAYALAIDASGDIWVTNFGKDTLTKFIGLAAPVKTPLSGLPQLP